MRVLDLFSGIGGFSLGLERAGMETVAFCEYDEKCRQVLKKHWPKIPQYNDVRTLTKEQLDNDGIKDIGLICGGYPCQPFSVAGKREGAADDRHLWPEINRLLIEYMDAGEPIDWCVFENVYGHISMGLDNVLADLENIGYSVWAFVVPAISVGAYHRRDRVWIVAYAEKLQRDGSAEHTKPGKRQVPEPGIRSGSLNMADTISERGRGRNTERQDAENAGESPRHSRSDRSRVGAWLPEPPVGRVANGVPGRVDRLKQLGNAVVPQIPEIIGRAILTTTAVGDV